MSRITPVASPSPPLRSASRHQTSPQSKSNFPDLSIHRKSSEPICESPTDFQILATKSTDAYQDEEHFPANCKNNMLFICIQQKIDLNEYGKTRIKKFGRVNQDEWPILWFALQQFYSTHIILILFVTPTPTRSMYLLNIKIFPALCFHTSSFQCLHPQLMLMPIIFAIKLP